MSNRKLPQVTRDLIAVRKLIEDKRNWCAQLPAKYNDSKAVYKRCVGMALGRILLGCDTFYLIGYDGSDPAAIALDKVALDEFGEHSFSLVNDNRGHAATLKMIDHAISYSLKGVKS